MTRVLHTGDTHLGYRQYHSPERREDFLSAFETVARDAVDLEVDAVVHAGDLFHDRRPDLPDLLGCLGVLRELDAAGIPFLGVVGNHEAKRGSQWLDLFASMGLATRLGREPVVVGDVAFYGLDFVPRSEREDLAYEFESHDADHAALVAHGLFEPLVPDYGNVEWDAAEVLAESTVDFEAMLLGDEHAADRTQVEGTWVTYCGSTERTSASERDERGYNLVTFDQEVHITRRGIETREFVFVDLELAAGEGFERVRDRLEEYDLEDAVVHVTLDGDGEDVSPARIEGFASEEGALVARVNDRRELPSEDVDLEVAFADPDDAVRERIREMRLSDAARELDETIRGDAVPDTNVADEVERRVSELLEDPEVFDAPQGEPDRADATDDSEDVAGSDVSGKADPGTAGETDPDAADGADPDATGETDADEATTSEAGSSTDSDAESTAADGDGQASMEDYL